jgi:hypothetical protein
VIEAVEITPSVHLWAFNHPLHGISEQIEFFLLIMRQKGYAVSIGRQPRLDALNVVIENFSEATSSTLIDFCESTGKRVGVIMTEHLDFINGQIYIHGEPLWNNNDYMHPMVQFSRIKNLMDCVKYLSYFFVLGDLPTLQNVDAMFPGLPVRALPFPQLDLLSLDGQPEPEYKAIFTGVVTAYRGQLLTQLEQEMPVLCLRKFVSRRARDKLNFSAKLVLNLPQRVDWKWLSLMRVIAGLQCGRATISLGTKDTSRISQCCEQLDISKDDWMSTLLEMTANWKQAYRMSLDRYNAMALDFEQEQVFPHDVLDCWGVTDRLPSQLKRRND